MKKLKFIKAETLEQLEKKTQKEIEKLNKEKVKYEIKVVNTLKECGVIIEYEDKNEQS